MADQDTGDGPSLRKALERELEAKRRLREQIRPFHLRGSLEAAGVPERFRRVVADTYTGDPKNADGVRKFVAAEYGLDLPDPTGTDPASEDDDL